MLVPDILIKNISLIVFLQRDKPFGNMACKYLFYKTMNQRREMAQWLRVCPTLAEVLLLVSLDSLRVQMPLASGQLYTNTSY